MPQPEASSSKQSILLDTCIIQYLADNRMGDEFVRYLKVLIERTHLLAISEITIYELLQGTTITKENDLIALLPTFKRYQVSESVLIAAARLRTLFDMEHIPQLQISDGDKIIAATSVLTGSFILTSNVNDFPRPFFIEVERQHVTYAHKNTQRMIAVYLLAGDQTVLGDRFSRRPKS